MPVPEPPAVPQAPARPETAPLTPGAEGIFLGTLASYEITGAEDYDRVVRRLVDPEHHEAVRRLFHVVEHVVPLWRLVGISAICPLREARMHENPRCKTGR